MVRENFLKTINETIEINPKFSVSDFSVVQRSTTLRGYKTTIEIHYNYVENYIMKINIPNSRTKFESYGGEVEDYSINCEISPGEIEFVEKTDVRGLKGVVDHISLWLTFLWDELMAIPVNRDINNLKNSMNELFEQMKDFSDESFTEDEKEEYKIKLDELELKFEDNLKSQELEKKELEKKINFLHKEISSLKSTLNVFNKNKWYKSLGAKILTWGAKPENQKLISNGAKLFNGLLDINEKI